MQGGQGGGREAAGRHPHHPHHAAPAPPCHHPCPTPETPPASQQSAHKSKLPCTCGPARQRSLPRLAAGGARGPLPAQHCALRGRRAGREGRGTGLGRLDLPWRPLPQPQAPSTQRGAHLATSRRGAGMRASRGVATPGQGCALRALNATPGRSCCWPGPRQASPVTPPCRRSRHVVYPFAARSSYATEPRQIENRNAFPPVRAVSGASPSHHGIHAVQPPPSGAARSRRGVSRCVHAARC